MDCSFIISLTQWIVRPLCFSYHWQITCSFIYVLNGLSLLFACEVIHHFNHSTQTVIEKSVIVQVIIYNRSLSLGGHLKTPPLAKGGEGIVDVQLTSLCCGPQGAKAWWCPWDVHIVVVVWWRVRVWVRVGGDCRLLLLGRGCAPRSPGARRDPTGRRRHLILCSRT